MAERQKRYRKNGVVKLGKDTIDGLRKRPDGRYYAASQPNKTFGRDLAQAVYRFRAWQASNRTERITLSERRPPSEAVKQSWAELGEDVTEVTYGHRPPADAFFARVREMIFSDPQQVAERTGIPEIAYLDRLQAPGEPISLADVVAQYLGKPMTSNERTQVKNQWAEFCRITGATTVADLDRPAVAKYESHYRRLIAEGKFQKKTVRNRWHRVKSILNYVTDRVADNQRPQIERARVVCRALLKPERSRAVHKPKPISRDHLAKLLAVADDRMKVAILCGVNLGLYAKEVSDLTFVEFDLRAKTFDSRRIKTGGTPRMGMLWDRTVEAIRTYRATIDPKHTTLLAGDDRDDWPARQIFKKFAELRETPSVPKSVTASHLRDGTDTRATESGASDRICRVIMGHSLGIPAHYAQIKPELTGKAMDYIERYYFPTKKSRGKK